MSSSSTPNQELFKDIRNACVRSLNIEVCYTQIKYEILFSYNTYKKIIFSRNLSKLMLQFYLVMMKMVIVYH